MRDGERLTIPVAPAGTSLAARLLTVGLPVLVLVGAFLPGSEGAAASQSLLMFVFMAGAAALALLFWIAPRRLGYALGATDLMLYHLNGTTRLLLSAAVARRSTGRLGWRTFGIGLPGHFSGQFTFGPDAHRSVIAVASRPDHGVIVEHGQRAYFLTPADPDAFLAELQQRGATVTQ